MRKISVLLICLAFLFISSKPVMAQIYKTDLPSKAIHVVYDDSGSMIMDDYGEYLDRWVQAKYAMEVFAAMLDEKDTMSVYFMSDFDVRHNGNVNASAKFKIEGGESPDRRVARIHNTVTEAWNTPYDAVAKAYADLKSAKADEKWLVVLTDGDFNQFDGDWRTIDGIPFRLENPDRDNPEAIKKAGDKANSYFSQYVNESNVKIIILAMGNVVKTTFEKKQDRIFYERARNSDEILERITYICNIIFKRIPYPDRMVNMQELEFDLPMTEFLVFAQGKFIEDVKIKGIDSSTISPRESVKVRYIGVEEAARNYPYFNNPKVKEKIPSDDLIGVVAKYMYIPEGKYSLEIAGRAKTVEVYIKPEVKLQIKMYQDRGEIPINNENKNKFFNDINEGKYRIEYGIIDANGNFFVPKILKQIELKAEVQNDGKTIPITKSGETVKLTQGEAKVLVQARYKDINLAEDTVTGKVLAPLSYKERLINWVQRNWVMLTRLFFVLLALFLIWLFWGPPKKKLPRNMAQNPVIKIEKGDDDSPRTRLGKFTRRKTYTPIVAEEGSISFVPNNLLPDFQVKAKNKRTMFLTNASSFTPDRHRSSGAEIIIGSQLIREGTKDNMPISCTATITTTFPSSDINPETKYICSLKMEKGHK
ncbi:MAG: hypothetical protein LBC76_05470 [Treponema sp.]|jgi:hypothetical protein|nr:hypothetical protein [Treponema sp.]